MTGFFLFLKQGITQSNHAMKDVTMKSSLGYMTGSFFALL